MGMLTYPHPPPEETVLQIIGRAIAAVMTTCHAGSPDEDTQEHLAAPEEQEENTEATPSLNLTLDSTSSETDTECRLEERSACGETPDTSVQEPGWGERIPQVLACRSARLFTSSAAEETDADFDGPGYRRLQIGVQHQMVGALESLPESCAQ